jgi:hypothetical protein
MVCQKKVIFGFYHHESIFDICYIDTNISLIPSPCNFLDLPRSSNGMASSNARWTVVMEVINHPKFLGDAARDIPFPFPERRGDHYPLFVAFSFEPTDLYLEVC